MKRQREPELMVDPARVSAYANADFRDVNAAFVERLLELTGDLVNAKAIDLGCGPGDIAVRVARARPGWRIVALEGSTAMLRFAYCRVERERLHGQIELRVGNARATGLPASSFDVIFSNSLLHHLHDPAWREINRLGRARATVLMRDLERPGSDADARRIVQQYAATEPAALQEEYYNSLLASFTVEELRRELRRAKLSLRVRKVTDRHMDVFGRL